MRFCDFRRAKRLCTGACTASSCQRPCLPSATPVFSGLALAVPEVSAKQQHFSPPPRGNSQCVVSQPMASSVAMVGNNAFFSFLLTAAPSLPVTSPWPSPSLQPSSSSLSSAACSRQVSETQVSCPEPPQVRPQTWKSESVRILFPLLCLVQCTPLRVRAPHACQAR